MPNLLQAGRSKYDGPKNHRAIIMQIHKDCKQAMSYDFINRVVGLFFSKHGIFKYLYRDENFRVPHLGSFYLSKKGQRKRARLKEMAIESARLSHNRKVSKYMKKMRARNAFDKVNKNRAEIGMEPLKFNTFIKITGRKL